MKMLTNALARDVKESEKNILEMSLYPDWHEIFMGSTLG